MVKKINAIDSGHCIKKRFFVLQKFVKTEKMIFLLVFVCFHFTEESYFLDFPWNQNVRKQSLSANAYFWVNMKFSYTKMKFHTSYVTKTSNYLLVFRPTIFWQYLSKIVKFSTSYCNKKKWLVNFLLNIFIFSHNILYEMWLMNQWPIFFSFMIVNASLL